MRHLIRHIPSLLLMTLLGVTAGCDSASVPHQDTLVVEAWIDTDAPLPPVRISSTVPTTNASQNAVPAPVGTDLELEVGDLIVSYSRDPADPLRFIPEETDIVPEEGDRFELRLEAPSSSITASGSFPPAITLSEVDVSFPGDPISVVLVDSLVVGLDSLNLSISATTGYIYPVQVSISWEDDGHDGWIEARLQPDASFSSSLIDFFLLPSQVFPETSSSTPTDGTRRWEGVYAVPVSEADSPIPEHSLHVVLTRGDNRFARFMTSRDTPERREPVSNVNGGLGFVGGISVDSTRISVRR